MSLPRFTHITPKTLDEALELLSEKGEDARIMAGGTDLIPAMKYRTEVPEILIDIKQLKELGSIRSAPDNRTIIGSLNTLDTVSRSELIVEKFNILARAAEKVASMQIRNVGTIGGNVCLNTRCWYYNQSKQWRQSIPVCYKMGGDSCLVMKKSDNCNAVFLADTVPALMALDAGLKIVKKGGERTISLEDFYGGSGHPPNLLSHDEILAEVQIPGMAPSSFGIFLKDAPRQVVDFALANAAIIIAFNERGEECKDARIVVAGVTSHPVRSVKAEDILKGEIITEKLMNEAADIVVRDSAPISPIWVSPETRRHMIRTLIKRGLQAALEFARGDLGLR
ncbi:MAG: FAD binding domain-containing protein [Thermodesulfobacteriota bacterium]|nr:FAD binding domain-containing protein [Thermodesulfobacteriota bacterium]